MKHVFEQVFPHRVRSYSQNVEKGTLKAEIEHDFFSFGDLTRISKALGTENIDFELEIEEDGDIAGNCWNVQRILIYAEDVAFEV